MYNRLPPDEKLKIIKRITSGESISKIAKETGTSRTILYKWLKKYQATGPRAKYKSLETKFIKTKDHWKSFSQLTERKVIKAALESPDLSVRDLSKQFNISIHGIWNILKRNNLNTKERKENYIYAHGKSLVKVKPAVDKLTMIRRFEAGESVISLCEEFKVSRTIFYRWLKRYQRASIEDKSSALENLRPKGGTHWKFIQGEYEEAVLSAVKEYPELSTHKLVWVLPQVGGTPIVSNHGVQNVLKRNNLSTYEQRISYARAYNRPTPASRFFGVFTNILSFIGSKQAADRKALVVGGFTFGFTIFGAIVIYGLISLIGLITSSASVGFSIGIVFALIALTFGMFFFIYSLKYYITIASILSFSRTLGSDEKKRDSDLHFNQAYQGRVGLKADLTNISLDTKPFVSIHLASYNEKKVIDRLLTAATSMEYDNYEVILVDDSNDPEAIDIVSKWKDNPRVKLIQRQSRSGYKGGALAIALEKTDPRAEFVMIFDSDFIPYPDSITQFLKYFKASVGTLNKKELEESNVAAVQGYQWHVLNKSENWITRGVRTEYAGSYVIERSGIELYSGLKQISGSVYIIRKDVLQKVGWGTSITEDFEMTLKLYLAGFKVVYTPYIQAPAEAVSTIKRLIRQRMRWAEGHSFNIKRYFLQLMFSKKLTNVEKGELIYLSPYYLQAFFFILGTLSWFLAEVVFQVNLPFWTSTWGWSLVFTNLFALPLMNIVGLFLEESSEKDYLGIFSFVAMTYIVAPFMGYASVKGFLEKEEGPWFRTPKTGKITDVFTPSRFYKFIFGIFGKQVIVPANAALRYSNLITTTDNLEEGHIQRIGDEYDYDEGYSYNTNTEYVQGFIPQTAVYIKVYSKWVLAWFKNKLGIIKESEKILLNEPRLAIQTAFSTFSNIKPPRRSQNTLIGKIILTSFIVLAVFINQITFMTQYDIDLANFSIKAKSGVPLIAQGGFPQGGPSQAAPDPSIEQQINIINQEFSSTSATDVPTDNSLGIVRYTSGSYDPAPTVYFEAILKNDTAGAVTTATLYDAPSAGTGAVAVYNSPVSVTGQTYTRVRSGAITLTTGTDYTVRVNASSGTAYIIAARIIVKQSTLTYIANTETQIEIGANETTTSTTTTNLLANPKIWKYTAGSYDGSVTAYFEATMKTSGANNANVILYDKTLGSTLSTLSYNTDTNWSRVRSTAITLVDGDEYEVGLYETTAGTASIANAKVIITQTSAGGLTATELYHDYITFSNSQNAGVIGAFSTTNQSQFPTLLTDTIILSASAGPSSYVYALTGNSGGARSSTVYKSTVNSTTGDLGSFDTTSQGQLLRIFDESAGVVSTIGSSSYIYVLGGTDGTIRSSVYKTTVNSTNGDLSTFATTSQGQLPRILREHAVVSGALGASTYIYVLGGTDGTNTSSIVYKAPIDPATGDAGTFDTTSQAQLPALRLDLSANLAQIGGSSYIYAIGGSTPDSTVYKSILNSTNGNAGTFNTTSQSQLPIPLGEQISTVSSIGPSSYLYVMGSNDGTASSVVYRSTINSTNGDIGLFNTTNQTQLPLPFGVFGYATALAGGSNYLYVIGGTDGTRRSTVYKSTLSDDYNNFDFWNLYDPDNWVGGTFTYYHEGTMKPTQGGVGLTANARITPGTLAPITVGELRNAGTFATTSQKQLLLNRTRSTTVVTTIDASTYMYVLGGHNGANTFSNVYKATVNGTTGDIGVFATTSQSQMLTVRESHTSVNPTTISGSNYIFVIGGGDDTTLSSTIYRSTLSNVNGNVGAFATTNQVQLPGLRYAHTSVTPTIGPSTYLFVLGGWDGSGRFSTVYKATLGGANGRVGAFATTSQGQLPTILSDNTTVVSKLAGSSYMYVLGGTDGTNRLSSVYKATLSASGNLSVFDTTSQAQLPLENENLSTATSTIGNSTYLYVIGGQGTGPTVYSTVYRSVLNSSTGDVGAFSTTSQAQLLALRSSQNSISASSGNSAYLYVLGGSNDGGTTVFSTVYKSTLSGAEYERVRSSSFYPFLPDNTNAQTFDTTYQGQLGRTLTELSSVSVQIGSSSYVYVLGGSDKSSVYKGVVNNGTGTIPDFSTTNQGQLGTIFTRAAAVSATVGSSTYIYALGGSTSVALSTLYKSNINNLSGDAGTFLTTSQAQFPLPVNLISMNTATMGGTTYFYVIGGNSSATLRSSVYKAQLDTTTGDVGAFATTSQAQFVRQSREHASIVKAFGSSTYLYVLGGNNGGRFSSVYKATINSSGDVSTAFDSTSQGQLPAILDGLSAFSVDTGTSSYLYVFGGNNGTSRVSTVYRSTFNATTGDLGAFSTTNQVQLPVILGSATIGSTLIGNSTYTYLIGGTTGSQQSSVYNMAIPTFPNTSGDVEAFATTNQGQYPAQLRSEEVALSATIGASTYIYSMGGYDGSIGYSSVYKSNLDNITGDAGTFSSVNQAQLPLTRAAFTGTNITMGTSTYIYVVGGGGPVSTIYKSTINGFNGDVGLFNTTNQAQLPLQRRDAPVTSLTVGSSSYLYVVGGCVGTTCGTAGNPKSTVYRATIKDDSGTGDTGVFATTSQAQFYALRSEVISLTSTIGTSTYLYTIGGFDGAATNSNVYKSTLDNTTGDLGVFATTSQAQLPLTLAASVGTKVTMGPSTYIYVVGGFGPVSTVYKSIINSTTGDLGAFNTASQGQLPLQRRDSNAATLTIGSSSYLYVIGGCLGSTCNTAGNAKSTVYKSTINTSTGDVSTFVTTSQAQLPISTGINNLQKYAIGGTNYLYLMGGRNGSGTALSSVYKATVDSSANVGAFDTTNQGQLPIIVSTQGANLATIGSSSYIYVLGGLNAALQSTVFRATINSTTGDLGIFDTTSQVQLPTTMRSFGVVNQTVVSSTYLYLIGGVDPTGRVSTVYKSTLNGSMVEGDLDTFATTSQAQLPVGLGLGELLTASIGGTNYFYSIGGRGDDGVRVSTVYKSTIDSSANVGAFSTASQGQLPTILASMGSSLVTIGSSSYIYVLGGSTGSAVSSVYRATIDSSTGDLGLFSTTNQIQIPAVLQAFGNVSQSVGSSNYIYLIAGFDGTNRVSTVYKTMLTADGNNLDTEIQNAQISASWLIINATSMQVPENLLLLLPFGLLLPHLVRKYKAWKARKGLGTRH